jgi:inorganic pyrophosphatase
VDVNLLTIPGIRNTGHDPRRRRIAARLSPQAEVRASWEAMGISRPLPVGLTFPFDWGFVPSTRGPDGDPVDAFVMWDVASFPAIVLECGY